jgi:hypothetical protein
MRKTAVLPAAIHTVHTDGSKKGGQHNSVTCSDGDDVGAALSRSKSLLERPARTDETRCDDEEGVAILLLVCIVGKGADSMSL